MMVVEILVLLQHPSVFYLAHLIRSAAYGFFMNKADIASYAVNVSRIDKVKAECDIIVTDTHVLIKASGLFEYFLSYRKTCCGNTVYIIRIDRIEHFRIVKIITLVDVVGTVLGILRSRMLDHIVVGIYEKTSHRTGIRKPCLACHGAQPFWFGYLDIVI